MVNWHSADDDAHAGPENLVYPQLFSRPFHHMSARGTEGNIRRRTETLKPSNCSSRQISIFSDGGNRGKGIGRFGGRRGCSEQCVYTQPISLDR